MFDSQGNEDTATERKEEAGMAEEFDYEAEDEFIESCKRARFEFNSIKSIIMRLVNFKANCANYRNIIFFLLANIVSRIEIHKKQGKKLGGGVL